MEGKTGEAGTENGSAERMMGAKRLHVVACIKMVPDTAQVRVDPATNTLIREGIPFITNPYDDHAVEAALSVKDRYGARVTVISMGPKPAETVIRKAIARGADNGILVSDRAFGGSDTLATSRIIAAAIRRAAGQDPVDIVICGRQTIDGDTGQVGPGIATRLGYAQVTLVDTIVGIDADAGRIEVRARFEDRYEIIEARLPVLITVLREMNRPRYPSVPGRLLADAVSIPTWSNETLKLDPDSIGLKGSPTWVRRIFAPERKRGEIVRAAPGGREAVETIMRKLEEWKVFEGGR